MFLALYAGLLWSPVATAFKSGLSILTPVQKLLLMGAVISTMSFSSGRFMNLLLRLPIYA